MVSKELLEAEAIERAEMKLAQKIAESGDTPSEKAIKWKYGKERIRGGIMDIQEKMEKVEAPISRIGKMLFKERPTDGQPDPSTKPKVVTSLTRILGGITTPPKKRTVVRRAPTRRLPTRKAKKPVSPEMQKKMAKPRAMKKQPIYRQPIPTRRMPISVRELQNTKNLRAMLPAHEKQRIDNLSAAFRRGAAINFLGRQLKQRELLLKRQRKNIIRHSPTYRQRVEIDLMTGRQKLVAKKVKKEAWQS